MNWMLFVLLFPVASFAQEPEFVFPDIEAKFPGGATALMDFIDKNRRNPLTPKDEDCKVYVSFVVAPNGHLEDLKVERGCYPVLDNEALRIFNIMPKWIPGVTEGKPIYTRCRMPIPFIAPTKKEWREMNKK